MSWGLVAVGVGTAVSGVAGGIMGNKKKGTSSTQNLYSNPILGNYTSGYMGAAPWGFQTLDPSATLASMRVQSAMGSGTPNANWDADGRYIGPAARKQELQALADAEKQEGVATSAALARIKQRQESGQFLTPQETEFINTSLDKAFEYAHKTGLEDWTKATQMMAGSRGMRMSDTPIADPALRELRNFELGLGSKRAEMGLNATMSLSAQQQGFDAAFVEFNKTLQQNRMATRQGFLFGGGLQGASQLGYAGTTAGMTTSTPGMMDTMSQFAGMAGNAMQAWGAGNRSSATPTPSSTPGYGGGMGLTGPSVGNMFG